MNTAIRLEGIDNAKLNRVHISGFDIGIQTRNTNLSAKSAHFDNVRQPFDLEGSTADISSTRIRNDPKAQIDQRPTMVGGVRSGTPGPAMPAHCPECDSIFPSRNYKVRNGKFYSRDNEETCMLCGNEHAKVADGIFDFTTETVRLLHGSIRSIEQVQALQAIFEQFANNAFGLETLENEISTVVPEVQSNLKKLRSMGTSAIYYTYVAIAKSMAIFGTYATAVGLPAFIAGWDANEIMNYHRETVFSFAETIIDATGLDSDRDVSSFDAKEISDVESVREPKFGPR